MSFFSPRSPSSALFTNFFGDGFPTKIDYRKVLTSLLEDLVALLGKNRKGSG